MDRSTDGHLDRRIDGRMDRWNRNIDGIGGMKRMKRWVERIRQIGRQAGRQAGRQIDR